MEVPQVYGDELSAAQGQEGGEGAGIGVPQQKDAFSFRMYLVVDAPHGVIPTGVKGIWIASEIVPLLHPLREEEGFLKGAGALHIIDGDGIGEIGMKGGDPELYVVHSGVEGAHPFALAAQEVVRIKGTGEKALIGVFPGDREAVIPAQGLRDGLAGEKAGLRGPVVVGAEKEGRPVPAAGGQGLPQVQRRHALFLQHGEDLVGIVVAVVRHSIRQAGVAALELLWGLDIEKGDIPLLPGRGRDGPRTGHVRRRPAPGRLRK